jgi:hypothetical protein
VAVVTLRSTSNTVEFIADWGAARIIETPG